MSSKVEKYVRIYGMIIAANEFIREKILPFCWCVPGNIIYIEIFLLIRINEGIFAFLEILLWLCVYD